MSKKDIKELQREVKNINAGVSMAFRKVGEEFTEHLDTINANTYEISALTQMMYVLEEKIDKLNERIDELTVTKSTPQKDFSNIVFNLTVREQEVFVILYTSERFLSLKELSRSVGQTTDNTEIILKRLVSKHIPIIKEISSKEPFYALEPHFKQLQAKQNLVKLNEAVLKSMY